MLHHPFVLIDDKEDTREKKSSHRVITRDVPDAHSVSTDYYTRKGPAACRFHFYSDAFLSDQQYDHPSRLISLNVHAFYRASLMKSLNDELGACFVTQCA